MVLMLSRVSGLLSSLSVRNEATVLHVHTQNTSRAFLYYESLVASVGFVGILMFMLVCVALVDIRLNEKVVMQEAI